MEKFLNLPMEKQNFIIDAALQNFAMHGYKKTSINDIASTAGISKATVFHYFGTKKELYLYLVNTCVNSISTEVIDKFDDSITDLFDRILYTSELKIALMKKHRSEEHTSELQSRGHLVCRLLLEKKNKQ